MNYFRPGFLSGQDVMRRAWERLKEGLSKNKSYSKWKLLLIDIHSLISNAKLYLSQNRKARLISIIAGLPTAIFIILLFFLIHETPDKDTLRRIRNPIASEVYTADSVLIGRYFIQDRTPLKYSDISPVVIDALIATEDVRFFNHHGVDFKSLGRVFIKTIMLQDESSGGGSTITQQLAKNLFPRKDYWIMPMVMNKLREAFIASKLENIYSKQEILTLYLNTIPFGDNTFGIQVAAQRFFTRDAKDLTAVQAAVLVGMLKATHNFNPRLFPENARARRNVVLAQMKKYKVLTETKGDSMQKLPLKLKYKPMRQHVGIAPYFRDYLKSTLQEWCEQNRKADGSTYNLETDGLKIYTTIDSKLQAYAEKAVTQQMSELQKQFFAHWGKEKPWKDNGNIVTDAVKRTGRYKSLKQQGLSEDAIMKEMRKPVLTRLFTWEGGKEIKVSPIDSIKHHLQYLNAGFLAIEPSSGEVKAWVGGISYDFFQYDHVKESTKRQVGSIFKPIVFAAAIEQGISPCEFIPAEQQTYIDEVGQSWTPRNTQSDYQVQYSMRGALAYSVNTVSVKLINRAGIDNTIKLTRNMGIRSEIPDVPSIALGSTGISIMEMTGAYACFANEGVSSYPLFIHGLGGAKENYWEACKSDALANHTLICFDNPGTGNSTYYEDFPLNVDDLTSITSLFIEKLNLNNFILTGTSMGGLTTLLYLQKGGLDKVKAYINIEGNLLPEDCMFSSKVVTYAYDTFRQDVFPNVIKEMKNKGNTGYHIIANNLQLNTNIKSYYNYSFQTVEYSSSGKLLTQFIKMEIPKIFIYGDENKMLSYIPELIKNGVNTKAISQSNHFIFYDNPKEMYDVIGSFINE